MSENIFYITNDRFRLLYILYKNTCYLSNKTTVIPFSQMEICKLSHFGKNKVNELTNDLIDMGFLLCISRGRYTLTNKGVCVINQLKALSNQLNDISVSPYRVMTVDFDGLPNSENVKGGE